MNTHRQKSTYTGIRRHVHTHPFFLTLAESFTPVPGSIQAILGEYNVAMATKLQIWHESRRCGGTIACSIYIAKVKRQTKDHTKILRICINAFPLSRNKILLLLILLYVCISSVEQKSRCLEDFPDSSFPNNNR